MFEGRNGVFYWIKDNGDGTSTVTYFFAMTGIEDDVSDNDENEKPSTGYYSFGLIRNDVLKLTSMGFLRVDSNCNNIGGCSTGPGRRLIIWYDTHDDDSGQSRPEIATVYYHVAIDPTNYEQLKSRCSSSNRNETWNGFVSGDSTYAVCLVQSQAYLGVAEQIGFSDAPHLHYEVYIDVDNNGQIDTSPSTSEREDPLMAFATIR